jgi:predicted transcriptional regulator
MDNDIMKEQGLRDVYYNPKTGFQTPEKLYQRAISDGLEVTKAQVRKWIKEQDTYTRYRQVLKRNEFRQTLVQTLGEQLQMDLVDMTKYDDKNKGYRWILTSIEILSRYVFTVPVHRKNAATMKEAVSNCLEQFKNHFGKYPKLIQFDKGTEFYSK